MCTYVCITLPPPPSTAAVPPPASTTGDPATTGEDPATSPGLQQCCQSHGEVPKILAAAGGVATFKTYVSSEFQMNSLAKQTNMEFQ